jgi:hypothetical protein
MNRTNKKLFLLDFGLARKYRSSSTLKHYPKCEKKKLTGTARYASINALNGTTQSRRDDLESVGYVLMYLLRGNLPWQGLVVKNKNDKYSVIKEKKISTSANELCKNFPKEFENFVNYTRNLDYEDEPDYEYLKKLFLKVLNNSGFELDFYYDWNNNFNFNSNINNLNSNVYKISLDNHYNHSGVGTYHNNMNNNENSHLGTKKNSKFIIIPEKHDDNNHIVSQERQIKENYYENLYNNNMINLKSRQSNNNILNIEKNNEENQNNHNNNNENKENIQNNKINNIKNNHIKEKNENNVINNTNIIFDKNDSDYDNNDITNNNNKNRHNKNKNLKSEDNKCCIIF